MAHHKSQLLMRETEVLKVIPVSRTTWLLGVKSGHFPRPVKLGPKLKAWRTRDIEALIGMKLESPAIGE